jgi:uncharacterized protein (TIGR02421 family)
MRDPSTPIVSAFGGQARALPACSRFGSRSLVDIPQHSAELLAALRPVEELMVAVARKARVLPALTPMNAASERARLVELVARGEAPNPRWELVRRPVDVGVWRTIDVIRALVYSRIPRPLRDLYLARVDELEVDVAIIEAVGNPVKVRPLAARRYGTGMREVELDDGPVRVNAVARGLLERLPPAEEVRSIPPEQLASMLRQAMHAVGLPEVEVRIDARLVAGAATGDRGVFLASRPFGRTEARRLIVHEVLGHAVAAANATYQPLRVFEIGTAGSFADQEGLAICLEEEAGALDIHRLRVLAARVVATDRVHAGASFGETARHLHVQHGFSPEVAVLITERAYRGGGIARDAAYLYGYLRVRTALRRRTATIDALRAGRIGLSDLAIWPDLVALGLARPPAFQPSVEQATSLAPEPVG